MSKYINGFRFGRAAENQQTITKTAAELHPRHCEIVPRRGADVHGTKIKPHIGKTVHFQLKLNQKRCSCTVFGSVSFRNCTYTGAIAPFLVQFQSKLNQQRCSCTVFGSVSIETEPTTVQLHRCWFSFATKLYQKRCSCTVFSTVSIETVFRQ